MSFLLLSICLLSGCLSGVWTGASLIYDRHNVYKKLSDYKLSALVNQVLFKDNALKRPDVNIEIAVFNGDILLVGVVSDLSLREEIYQKVRRVTGYRRLFNQIAVSHQAINSLEDSWITGEIRSRMIADSSIDPAQFKVVTYHGIVYLMGDVEPNQAKLVIDIARQCSAVIRVVLLLKYFNLSDKAALPVASARQ